MQRKGSFDADGFYQALDSVRLSWGLTWKDVAAQSGVSASTLTRMAQGRRPDVDSLAALVAWSSLSADQFLVRTGSRSAPEPLTVVSAYLRSDPHLSADAATAIQAVLAVAYERLRRDVADE